MELFEWRERVSDCNDIASLTVLRNELMEHYNNLQQSFSKAIESRHADTAVDVCIRMKYFNKMLEEIDTKS
jgi:DnaJ-domain-containing protein 1